MASDLSPCLRVATVQPGPLIETRPIRGGLPDCEYQPLKALDLPTLLSDQSQLPRSSMARTKRKRISSSPSLTGCVTPLKPPTRPDGSRASHSAYLAGCRVKTQRLKRAVFQGCSGATQCLVDYASVRVSSFFHVGFLHDAVFGFITSLAAGQFNIEFFC